MANEDERPLEVEPGDLILRGEGKVLGIHSTRRTRRKPEEPAQAPEPKRHTRHEAAEKIARTIVESTVTLTEEEALAKAAELASEAAARMDLGRIAKKKTKTGLLWFLKKK